MKVKQYDSAEEIEFELFYKGNNEEDVEEIRYEVEYGTGKFGSEKADLSNGKLLKSSSRCSGCALTSKTQDISVEIEWGAKIERIRLE